jgi:hypothetical protein
VAVDTTEQPFEIRNNPDGSTTKIPYPGVFNEVKNFKTVYESITAGRKKFLKYYDKTPHQNSSIMSVL